MARRGRHPYNKSTKTMTEYEKQQAGMVYNAPDADLVKELYACHDRCWEYNQTQVSDLDFEVEFIV